MTPTKLAHESINQLHGNLPTAQGLYAMMKKDFKMHEVVLDNYIDYFPQLKNEDEEKIIEKRREGEYISMVQQFYDLVSDFYEYGWCASFHFCRFSHGEGFLQAIARHEHYLAHRMGISANTAVLDVGSGLGAPAREIARFTDAKITGLNNNDYQIRKATHYTQQEGLAHKVSFCKGDFMQMTFPENSFDAAYAIEATVHAPDLQGVYSQIFRVLKPGATFGVYEWLLTEKYNKDNPDHRRIVQGIQRANGIAKLRTVSEAMHAIQDAGFELLAHEDMADRPDTTPWYYPLAITLRNARRFSDLFTYAPMSSWGRTVTYYMTKGLGAVGILPGATHRVTEALGHGADNLVEGGETGIFTPMYLMVARKPVM